MSGKNRCVINSVQLASSWRDLESGATCTLSWEDRCYSDWRLRRTRVCSLRRLIEWVGPVVTPPPLGPPHVTRPNTLTPNSPPLLLTVKTHLQQ